jgi:hypothetical protein
VLFLGYDDEPPNSAIRSAPLTSGSAFCFAASRNFSRSRTTASASRSSSSLFSSTFFLLRLMLIRSFDFLCKQNHKRAANKARSAKPPKTPPTIAPTGGRVVSLGCDVEGDGAVAAAEVAESVDVVDFEAAEVDADVVEPVDVNAEVVLEAVEVREVEVVERVALSVRLGLFEVFAVVGLPSLSSPQTPVSQGLAEQHPV